MPSASKNAWSIFLKCISYPLFWHRASNNRVLSPIADTTPQRTLSRVGVAGTHALVAKLFAFKVVALLSDPLRGFSKTVTNADCNCNISC